MSIIKATVFVICVCKAMAWFPQLKQCVIIVCCLAFAGTLSLIPVTIIGKTVSPVYCHCISSKNLAPLAFTNYSVVLI